MTISFLLHGEDYFIPRMLSTVEGTRMYQWNQRTITRTLLLKQEQAENSHRIWAAERRVVSPLIGRGSYLIGLKVLHR